MANYANQKTIQLTELEKITHKANDDKNRFILSIDFKYEAAAMRRLNGNAYKLWRYLLRWYGGDKRYEFSPAALKEELGLGKNGPSTAFDELVRVGYLRQDPNIISKYIFTPILDADYQLLSKKNDM